MYKVMLVDDELLILNGLKNIIDWTNLNLEIAYLALDGKEAYQKYLENPVDIIITDISMPEFNGLELIKKIKKINRNTKFIILSGYDDFRYAKEGISLGIENYILKPINEEELSETLKNTVTKFENQNGTLFSQLKNMDIIGENILYRWITNSISSYELEERRFLFDLDLAYKYYSVSIIKFNKVSNMDSYTEIYKYIKNCDAKLRDGAVFVDLEGNAVLILGNNDIEGIEARAKEVLENKLISIKEKFGIDLFITQGNIEAGYTNVYKSYETAKELQNYLLIKGYNKIVTYKDYSSTINMKHVEGIVDFREFNKILLSKNKSTIQDFIENVFDKFCLLRDIKPVMLQDIAIRMMLTLSKLSKELNINNEKEEDLRGLILEICSIKTVEELKLKIVHESNILVEKSSSISTNLSPVIQQILSFINKNYSQEMSLKTLGNKYNINPSYLGQVFHKEVGEPFSDYINKIKNEKAKELLLTTNLKVSDVAKMVGYDDNSYFYRRFKEYFGISPNTLRGSKNY
jgi:two-component system, response regulator YesN